MCRLVSSVSLFGADWRHLRALKFQLPYSYQGMCRSRADVIRPGGGFAGGFSLSQENALRRGESRGRGRADAPCALALTMTIWIFHAHCHDRHRLCGTGVRRLLRGFRPPGHLRRQGRRQDRQPAPRRDPDFRARARCAGRRQCEGRPAGFHHRSRRTGRRGRCGVHRGRHAVAARRRPRRPELRPYRRARDRRSTFRLSRWW